MEFIFMKKRRYNLDIEKTIMDCQRGGLNFKYLFLPDLVFKSYFLTTKDPITAKLGAYSNKKTLKQLDEYDIITKVYSLANYKFSTGGDKYGVFQIHIRENSRIDIIFLHGFQNKLGNGWEEKTVNHIERVMKLFRWIRRFEIITCPLEVKEILSSKAGWKSNSYKIWYEKEKR